MVEIFLPFAVVGFRVVDAVFGALVVVDDVGGASVLEVLDFLRAGFGMIVVVSKASRSADMTLLMVTRRSIKRHWNNWELIG